MRPLTVKGERVDVSIMIEGQMGLDWPRWTRIAEHAERLGYAGLYRSDHFLMPWPTDDDSLEMVTSLTWLASHTARLRFGALVAPVSFREPIMYARQAAAIAGLAGTRYLHGLGAGWMDREHDAYGYTLGDVGARVARLEEALQVTSLLLRSTEPVSFQGEHYRLADADPASPRPDRPVPICVGARGPVRMLPLVARYADVWNVTGVTPDGFRERSERLDALLAAEGRKPGDLRRTVMTGIYFGADEAGLEQRLERLRGRPETEGKGAREIAASLTANGLIAGTPEDVREQLAAFEAAGCEEIMLQWLWLDDLDGIGALAEAVLG